VHLVFSQDGAQVRLAEEQHSVEEFSAQGVGASPLVIDIEWMNLMTTLFGWMTPGEVRHFPLGQRDEAIAWAAG